MGEIQLIKVKSSYGDLKGLLSQIPLEATNSIVDEFTVSQLNTAIDNLTNVSGSDYSGYKVPESKQLEDWPGKFPTDIVRAQLGRIINRLEMEYSFGTSENSSNPGIVIINKNESEFSLEINYTINELISKQENEESRGRLKDLKEELSKGEKNWENIKNILIWILNFSKDLFIQVIPIILQKKI
jgi:hypothetical protein